eukprot:g10336.t1
MTSNSSSPTSKKAPKAAAAAVALSAMLAFNVCPAEAFAPSFLVPSSRMMHRGPSFSSALAPAAVTMDCSPWDMECYGVHPFGGAGGLQRRRQMQQRRSGPMIFAPEDLLQGPAAQPQQQQFAISNPTVTEDTDDLYTLSFDLPADVDHDGLEVSVSGRLLTVKATVTREEDAGPSARRGGWVTRSSRTDSVSRSFVLPEGLSTSSAAASLLSDGKAEVKFAKDQAVSGAAATATVRPKTPPKTDHTVPVIEAPASRASPAEAGTFSPDTTTAAAAAGEPAAAGGDAPAAADTPATSSTAEAPSPGAERPASLPESPFDVLDQELREFAKAMWGEEMLGQLQVPTKEELVEKTAAAKEARAKRQAAFAERVEAAKQARAKWEAEFAERAKAAEEARVKREAEFAERVEAAKKDRAKRVVAMRRATMASDVLRAEDGSSYLVRVALPEGVTRDNVKLVANPNSSLRVTVSANSEEGGRSMYKDVSLPKDALIEDISAKFQAEQQQDETENNQKQGVNEEAVACNVAGGDAVSGLEVTVGRAVPPQPKTIDIL